MQRRLPAGARALIRHGQHPLRHRVADEDLLLDADLERHLPRSLVDTLLPDSPEDALVPLGRAWMQAKQARKELAAAAGMPDAWHMVGGLQRPIRSALTLRCWLSRPSQRPGADVPLTPCHATCWWWPVQTPSPWPPTPNQSSCTPITPDAAPTSLVWYTGPRGHVRALKDRAHALGLEFTRTPFWRMRLRCRWLTRPRSTPGSTCPSSPSNCARAGVLRGRRRRHAPTLLEVEDIRGDLHMHTVYSDGRDSVAGMVHAARALGYRYLAITDHSPRLAPRAC